LTKYYAYGSIEKDESKFFNLNWEEMKMADEIDKSGEGPSIIHKTSCKITPIKGMVFL